MDDQLPHIIEANGVTYTSEKIGDVWEIRDTLRPQYWGKLYRDGAVRILEQMEDTGRHSEARSAEAPLEVFLRLLR